MVHFVIWILDVGLGKLHYELMKLQQLAGENCIGIAWLLKFLLLLDF